MFFYSYTGFHKRLKQDPRVRHVEEVGGQGTGALMLPEIAGVEADLANFEAVLHVEEAGLGDVAGNAHAHSGGCRGSRIG